MGVITNLIRMNEEKKQADFERQLGVWSEIAGLPNASDEARSTALQNVATLAGGKLGLPKQHHGTLHALLGHLAGLNPAPKDESKAAMKQLPQPGAGKAAQPTSDPREPGTPAVPAYSPFLTNDQVAERANRQQADAIGAQGDAEQGIQDRARTAKQARLQKLFQDGTINKTEYDDAILQSEGVKSNAFAKEIKDRVKVKMPDGSLVDAEYGKNSGMLFPMGGGEPFPLPQGATIEQAAKPPADPAKIRELVKAYEAGGFSEAEATQMAGWVIRTQADLGNKQKIQQTARTSQQRQIEGEFSGDMGASPSTEPPPFSSPGHPNGSARTPARTLARNTTSVGSGAPTGGSSTPNAPKPTDSPKGAKDATGATGATSAKPAKSVDSTPKANGPKSQVQVQQLISNDRQVQLAQDYLLGTLKGARNQGMMIGIEKGINKLMQYTGIPDRNALRAEVVERDGAGKALGMGTQRLAAYDQGAGFVDAMAKNVMLAKAKFGNDPKFWQRVKNNAANNITGDPDTDALVTAINGYQSAYSRVMSGGQMSTAQTHVAAQERAGKVIDAAQKGTEINVILKQVRQELDNERDAIVSNNSRIRKTLMAPWGQFDAAEAESGTPKVDAKDPLGIL